MAVAARIRATLPKARRRSGRKYATDEEMKEAFAAREAARAKDAEIRLTDRMEKFKGRAPRPAPDHESTLAEKQIRSQKGHQLILEAMNDVAASDLLMALSANPPQLTTKTNP